MLTNEALFVSLFCCLFGLIHDDHVVAVILVMAWLFCLDLASSSSFPAPKKSIRRRGKWLWLSIIMAGRIPPGLVCTWWWWWCCILAFLLHLQYVCIHIEHWQLWLHLMGVFQGGQTCWTLISTQYYPMSNNFHLARHIR